MTFPEAPRYVRTELKINGVWVKADVYTRHDIVIKRSRQNESGQAEHSECSLTLEDKDGKYNPRNPLSPLFGHFGRNTPLRVVLLSQTEYGLVLPGGPDRAFTPDSPQLSVTADIDVRIDMNILAPDVWGTGHDLINKWLYTGNQRSWALITLSDGGGKLSFRWSENGSTARACQSSVPPTTGSGRLAVRATLDVDNGAGSHVVTFYTAPTLAGPWTQLGTPQTAAGGGTTSIFDSNNAVRVGAASEGGLDTWGSAPNSVVYAAEIRNGINGTVVANPDYTAQAAEADTFTDAAGNLWDFTNEARIGRPMVRVRFDGEISSLPPKWDTLGMDPNVPIVASGILRRIGQGTQPVNSGLKQHLLTTNPNAYWPLDDGPSSTQGANVSYPPKPFNKFTALSPGPVVAFGEGDLGTHLPKGLQITSATNGNLMVGSVGNASTTDSAVEFVYRAEVLGPLTLTLQNHGNWDWKLKLRGDGVNNDIQLSLVDFSSGSPANVDLADTAPLAAITDKQTHHVRLRLTQNGANTDYTVYVDGTQVISGTRTNHTLTGTSNVHFAYDATGDDTPVAVGHVAAWTGTGANPVPAVAGTSSAALGFAGETAGRRLERQCGELGIPFTSVGNLDDTIKMGPQFTDYFSNQLTEIETTDHGLLYDDRDSLALAYRTRTSLYNQPPKATINYAAGELAGGGLPFEPVEDDQNTRNDIFAQRREGSSYQATLTTGRLSVQEPPNGVGRYKDEVQVNVQTDDMLPEIAGWFLRLGTVDEARYPRIAVNLGNKHIVANPTLAEALLDTDIGDRLVITNLDKLNIYDDISVLVLGSVETLNEDPRTHTIEFNCTPASPYDVLQLDESGMSGAESRVSPGDDSSRLINDVSSGATALEVTGAQRTYWTTNAGDMPISIMLGGEEMSVTAVTGGTAPVFVGVGTSATGNNTSVTPGLPAGIQIGDLVLIHASIRNSGTGTVNTPAGWGHAIANGNQAVFGRIYDGVWSMPAITFTGGVAGADTIAQSCAFRGVTFAGSQWFTDLNSSAQNIALHASAAVLMDKDPVLVIFTGWKQDDWTTPNGADPPAGVTEIGEQVSTAGDDAGQVWGYRILDRDENIDNLSFTITGGLSAISRSIIATYQSRQVFTVTRAANGVVKAHTLGAVVRLKREAGLAL